MTETEIAVLREDVEMWRRRAQELEARLAVVKGKRWRELERVAAECQRREVAEYLANGLAMEMHNHNNMNVDQAACEALRLKVLKAPLFTEYEP